LPVIICSTDPAAYTRRTTANCKCLIAHKILVIYVQQEVGN
jgi:hypothetical protein